MSALPSREVTIDKLRLVFAGLLLTSVIQLGFASGKPVRSASAANKTQRNSFTAASTASSQSVPAESDRQLTLADNTGAQSIVLSYSTYLPPQSTLFGDQEGSLTIASVDSSGAACVTDGTSLWAYDPAGTPTLFVPSIRSASGLEIQNDFVVSRDTKGNCFLAGFAAFAPPGALVFGKVLYGVAKFGPTGNLVFAAMFGGTDSSFPPRLGGITVDSSGSAYVIGTTESADFPTRNALQNLLQGPFSSFVLKLDPTGTNVVYSTFFGNNTGGNAIATDAAGDAFIIGGAKTSAGDSITTTPGAFQTSAKSKTAPFVAKLDANGALLYATYLGGSVSDGEADIAVDGSGNAYVAGGSCSPDFPVTTGAYQTTSLGCNGVVSKVSADGSALVYSTFLGGSDANNLNRIALDGNGVAYVIGDISGGGGNFPLVNPVQADVPRETLTAINSSGTALLYSTLFGGPVSLPMRTQLRSVGVDASGNAYVSGFTGLLDFPILAANNGVLDPFLLCPTNLCVARGFIAKISPVSGAALASPSGVNFGLQPVSLGPKESHVFVANVGTTSIQVNSIAITGDYSIKSNTCSGTLLSALHCEVVVDFKPTAGGTRTGTLTITSDAPDSPRNIQLTGVGGLPQVSLSVTSLALTSPSVGSPGPAQTITLTNTGADILNISGLAITGSSATDFSESHTCTAQLNAGSSCQINASYKASTSSTELAAVQITNNAAGSPHLVNLTGIISALGLALAPGMPSSATVSAGQSATYNLVVGGPGFSGTVSLSCFGAPVAASCSVPGSVIVGSTPTPFQAIVTTTARSPAAGLSPPSGKDGLPTIAFAVLGFSMLGIALVGEIRRRTILMLACVCLCVIAASCGGGGPKPPTGTPAGTYTLAVTANNGTGVTQTVNLTLEVN